MRGHRNRTTPHASTAPTAWAATNGKTDAGAIPANVSESVRAMVTAEFAKLVGHRPAQRLVDRRQDTRRPTQERDMQTAVREGVGHLQADVAAAHDGSLLHRPRGQVLVDAEAVVHGVQTVHAGQIQAGHVRTDRLSPRRDHQPVVGNCALTLLVRLKPHVPAVWIDGRGGVPEDQFQASFLQLRCGTVGEPAPVGRLAAQIER
jgi:hypothetical protein